MAKSFPRSKPTLAVIGWILLGVGLAIFATGFYVPQYFCADGCSFARPNFIMLNSGLTLAISGGICLGTKSSKMPGVKLTVGGKRGIGWVSAIFTFLSLVSLLNAWAWIIVAFAVAAATPFILIGLIIWGIARGISRKKAKAGSEEPTIAESNKTL